MAGYVAAIEISLLGGLIWTLTPGTGTDLKALAVFSLKDTALVVPYLLAAGLFGGVVAAVLLPQMSATVRQLSLECLLALWVLGPFIHIIFGQPAVNPGSSMFLLDALITMGLGVTAYRCWFLSLCWLRAGETGRVIWTVIAVGAGLWAPPLAVYLAIP